jgi:hypothetical protein
MNDFEQAMAEFLSKGGKIQEVPSGKSGIVPGQSNSPWGRKKAAAPVAEELEEVLEPEVIDLDELVEAEEAAADEDDIEE